MDVFLVNSPWTLLSLETSDTTPQDRSAHRRVYKRHHKDGAARWVFEGPSGLGLHGSGNPVAVLWWHGKGPTPSKDAAADVLGRFDDMLHHRLPAHVREAFGDASEESTDRD